jgi:uncharacterized membrane protein
MLLRSMLLRMALLWVIVLMILLLFALVMRGAVLVVRHATQPTTQVVRRASRIKALHSESYLESAALNPNLNMTTSTMDLIRTL